MSELNFKSEAICILESKRTKDEHEKRDERAERQEDKRQDTDEHKQ